MGKKRSAKLKYRKKLLKVYAYFHFKYKLYVI